MRTADTAALVSDKVVLLVLKQVSEAIILPRYKRLSDADISTKTDANDFVTVADREAEADITSKAAATLTDRTELWHLALGLLFILLGGEAALLFRRRRESDVENRPELASR